jgi:hypothetical protein
VVAWHGACSRRSRFRYDAALAAARRSLFEDWLATFIFFLAMVLGVLPFVEGLVLGWPLQAVIGGMIAAFFLVAGHLARTPRSPR